MFYTEAILDAVDKFRGKKLHVSEDVKRENLSYFSSRAELVWIQSMQKKIFFRVIFVNRKATRHCVCFQ